VVKGQGLSLGTETSFERTSTIRLAVFTQYRSVSKHRPMDVLIAISLPNKYHVLHSFA